MSFPKHINARAEASCSAIFSAFDAFHDCTLESDETKDFLEQVLYHDVRYIKPSCDDSIRSLYFSTMERVMNERLDQDEAEWVRKSYIANMLMLLDDALSAQVVFYRNEVRSAS